MVIRSDQRIHDACIDLETLILLTTPIETKEDNIIIISSSYRAMNGELHGPPSAPSPGLILFNCEDQSDIIFIVTVDPNGNEDTWRFPAHSFILQDSSPIFQDLIAQIHQREKNPSNHQKPIINIQCRPEIFHMLMSYIYKKEVNITSKSNCIALLEVSVKFMLTELTQICLTFLRNHITESNVLELLAVIQKTYSSSKDETIMMIKEDNCDLVIPPITPNHGTITSNDSNAALNDLIAKCYAILDENAEKILASESLLRLDRAMLRTVLSRDTLNLSNECIAFECLDRWSTVQCQKQQRELTNENKRQILGRETLYLVRYLTMSLDQFMRGPYLSDILPDLDKEALRLKLLNPSVILAEHLIPFRMDIPRKFVAKPIVAVVLPQQRIKQMNEESTDLSQVDPGNLKLVVARKKNSPFKKLLNGLGDVMICVIQLLD